MSVAESPRASRRPVPQLEPRFIKYEPTVVQCYALFDKFFPACGLLDYTEGIYAGDETKSYEDAQRDQISYVLDEVRCGPGMRILEVGCGNGTLLDEVRLRGAEGIGITISPEQVRLGLSRGLDVRLLDYKDLSFEYRGRFDAVVCNGPIEHFVQPQEAAAGLDDEIYRRMFVAFHDAIDPDSDVRRFVNTTIHFTRTPNPSDLMKSPFAFKRGTDERHWAWLARSFGGWYPTMGQFQRCASGLFDQTRVVDGTDDYRLTSEEWLRRIRGILPTWKGFKVLMSSVPFAVRHPRQTFDMLTCMLWAESWNWQFRGPNAPTCLLRQTWEYRA
jgi:cyclopropane fatty-acyl-phospholipid synthase-like methyltransferase